MSRLPKRLLKVAAVILTTPIVLFLLLALLLYIPAVQQFAVDRVTASLSESTGMEINVKKIRLAFPLDLGIHRVTAIEGGDTLLDARRLRLGVRLTPLFKGRIESDGFALYNVRLNSKSYIPDTYIDGHAAELSAETIDLDWKKETVNIGRVRLDGADLQISLSDTAAKDTTESYVKWLVNVGKASIDRSKIRLTMPGDSMRIAAEIGAAGLNEGLFDIGQGDYRVRSLCLKNSAVNYDLPYQKSVEGIDPNHLALTALSCCVDTFSYNHQGVLRSGLRGLTLKERCGLEITGASGTVYMDSLTLRVPTFSLSTPYSRIRADLAFDFLSIKEGRGGNLSALIDASISDRDIRKLARGYVDAKVLGALPHKPLTAQARLSGNVDRLRLSELQAEIPGVLRAEMKGTAINATRPYRQGGADFRLHLQELSAIRALLPRDLTKTINIPNDIRAEGKLSFNGDRYNGRANLSHGGGRLTAKGEVNLRGEKFSAQATSTSFPLSNFLKGMPLGAFTGNLNVAGHGFDVLSGHSHLVADARIASFNYDTYRLDGTRFHASLNGENLAATFGISNEMIETKGTLNASLLRSGYTLALDANLPQLDIRKMGLVKDSITLGTQVHLDARADKAFKAYSASGSICQNLIMTPRMSNLAKDIFFDFATSPDTTTAHISAGDLVLSLAADGDLPHLGGRVMTLLDEIEGQLNKKSINQDSLKLLLPDIDFTLNAGRDNPLYNFARFKGYSFSAAELALHTGPGKGIGGKAAIGALELGSIRLDTIRSYIVQDTTGVQLYALVDNNKKNPVPLSVKGRAYVLSNGAGLEMAYYDSKGNKGVDLGLEALISDGALGLRLYPHNPILAYRRFTVNEDNFIRIDRDHLITANVDLLADDGTGFKIYGEPTDSINDLSVIVNSLNLGELSNVLPYLPRISGMLSGDIHVTANPISSELSAMADIRAENFHYEEIALGDLGVEAVYLPKTGGEHHASAFVSSGEMEVLACDGTYFDKDGGTFKGEARLHDFPLHLLDGFLAGSDVALRGTAEGNLSVSGTLDRPAINGSLNPQESHIYSDVYGFDFRTEARDITIKNNRLNFDKYKLYSTGDEPLVLDGTLDMSDLSRMTMDFTMNARNFELINSKKKARSMVFGKVFTNFQGSLNGTPDNIKVRGKLDILDRTDVTYILKDSPLSVDDRLNDLVKFVSFADTTTVEPPLPTPTGFDLTLGLAIDNAARFHCNLSEDGQNYVHLEGGGDLTLRMTQTGDMRMTGRFTAGGGEMKYSLPVIPLKTFKLVPGSSVQFTGDLLNPTLDIAAKERTKAVVTEDDKQRSVAFDVGVSITKPLNEMGLEFTIEAPEDLGVQNQLASMSKEQRGKAAVALMATGMYMTDETMMNGSGFKANNALNAFLQNEIQQIAGSALKTIDINFGMESGTSEAGTETTDYSFQFAKRFWGDRISVIIGGKVSTGADARNSAESFIDNVSVEYRLDRSAGRYVKVFYDRNTQDPLEGQLTKGGAGLVLRRKTDRLGELFIFKKKKQ